MINRADKSGFANWWFTVDRVALACMLALAGIGLMLAFAASPAITGGPLTEEPDRVVERLPGEAGGPGVGGREPQLGAGGGAPPEDLGRADGRGGDGGGRRGAVRRLGRDLGSGGHRQSSGQNPRLRACPLAERTKLDRAIVGLPAQPAIVQCLNRL